jgi:hypothetical protein
MTSTEEEANNFSCGDILWYWNGPRFGVDDLFEEILVSLI